MKKSVASLALVLLCFIAAAQPRHISISEFRQMSKKDTTTVELTGVVTVIRNAEHGNLYIKDDTAEVLIYGIVLPEGIESFRSLDVCVGDTLTVVGRRTVYDNMTIEMKDGLFVSMHCGPDHKVSFDYEYAEEVPDVFPQFKGKDPRIHFSNWVTNKLNYPDAARFSHAEGTVLTSFVIDEKGRLTDIKVIEGVHPALDAEAVRVLSKSPVWTPGSINGKPVRVSFTFPVIFQL